LTWRDRQVFADTLLNPLPSMTFDRQNRKQSDRLSWSSPMYRFWNQSKFVLDIQFEETRVYKDTYAKGKLDLALELLELNCGQLKIELVREVTALPIDQLEALAKALLKFKKVKDLEK
jgi:hypothetical protein